MHAQTVRTRLSFPRKKKGPGVKACTDPAFLSVNVSHFSVEAR